MEAPPRTPAWAAAAAALGAGLGAKALALMAVPPASWSAALWSWGDDLAVGSVLGLLVWRAPRWLAAVLAGVVVGWLALNVLVVRALGTPLTAAMLRGFDPAMADSAAPSLAWPALGSAALVLGLGAGASWIAARARPPQGTRGPGALAVLTALSVLGTLVGLAAPAPAPAHRNACVALLRSLLPRALPPLPAVLPASVEAASIVSSAMPAAAPLAPLAGAAAGRSVVLVVLESVAARFVGPEAPGPAPMPFLDQLAREGLYCAQANAVYPDSIEGQVALFCGQPPIPDGEPGDYQQQSQRALPRVLRAHGYGSALFHAGRFAFLGMRDVVGPFGFDCLADAATIGGTAGSSFGIDEEATVDALLQWIAARPRTEPFLCCYLPIAGHHPYASPPGGPFDPTTQLGCYKNALRYADRALQRLHAGLCRLRAPEELLLCVVGDHGQAFGEHPGNFGHSLEVYEENLRVPLLFWAPGTALGGARTDAVCSHLDLVPTLLDLLGLDLLGLEPAARAGAPGRSLLRLPLRGGRVQAFTDWGELLLAARDGDWKYVLEATTGRERLFDLGKDPGEQRNVVGAHPQLAMALRRDALEFARAAR